MYVYLYRIEVILYGRILTSSGILNIYIEYFCIDASVIHNHHQQYHHPHPI